MRTLKAVFHGSTAALCALTIPTPAIAQEVPTASPIDSQKAVTGQTADSQTPPSDQTPPSPGSDVGIADIIVTATKTGATAAQKTPIAVSVFSSESLASSGVTNVKDLVSLTPNLNVSQTAANAQIYIRGIGSNNVFIGSDPNVTVHVDGVYIARAFSQFTDFVDIDRVEVLRGPQGTLYGRNAVGGTINVITRKPADKLEAKAQAAFGNYGLVQYQGYISGPLVPGLVQASISGNYIRHDDYVDNILVNQSGVNNADRGAVRGQLRVTPSASLELITRGDYAKSGERVESFSHLLAPFRPAPSASSIVGDYRKVALNTPQPIKTKNWGVSQEINYALSPVFSLKSLTAYRQSSYNLSVDIDATELNIVSGQQTDLSKQFTQEFNLNANVSRFKGVLGLFYFHEDERATLKINLNVPGLIRFVAPRVVSRSYAAFAQGTYDLTDRLSVVAGIRYTNDRKSVDQSLTLQPARAFPDGPNIPPFPFVASTAQTYDAFTPKFGINFQATPGILVFASATKGYKSGGTNYAADRPGTLAYGPETLWSYEAGLKSDLFDRRLRFNVTGFYYDYKDLQVQSLIAAGVTAISNAATARVKGLEIETIARPVPNLSLTANYSLLDSRYRRFPNASVPVVLVPYLAGDPRFTPATQTFDASDNRLNAAPSSSFSGSAQYDQDLGFATAFLRGDYFWQARAYYDPTNVNIASQPSYDLINLSAGLRSQDQGWSAQVIAKNVGNRRYLIAVGTNGVVPSGQAGFPRTVMLQLSKKW